MKIRFGYVAMAINLKDASPSKTINYTNYKKIDDDEVKLYKLKKLTEINLTNTKRILLYNVAHNIKVYRLTSKLVPLVTHPDVLSWDYINELKDLYKEIEHIIKKHNLRISAHPDHFTILASPRKDVVATSIEDLVYHNKVMSALGLTPDYGKLVLHVGGKYKGKKETIDRFKKTFETLDPDIANRLIIENDDKIYNITDVLNLCKDVNLPMVLDVHHHSCNNNGESLEDYLEAIFDTWHHQPFLPKVHLSSPRSEKNFRAHADNVDFDFFFEFIQKAKTIDRDFDIMIEAKNKNLALFNLMNDIKDSGKFKILNDTTVEF